MKAYNWVWIGLASLLALNGCATAQPQVDGRPITKWIAQLHDRNYAKRDAAVQALASEPGTAEAALPLLKRKLKKEINPNRQWWLKVALQQCKQNIPHPGEISATPGHSRGLQINAGCKAGDGPFTIVKHNGVRCWKLPDHTGNVWSYLYFVADAAFRQRAESVLDIQLTYLDTGTGNIGLDYDSTDVHAPFHGAYGNSPLTVHRINSGQWRTVCFHVHNARFRGSENGGSDFRFYAHGNALLIRSVRVWPAGS